MVKLTSTKRNILDEIPAEFDNPETIRNIIIIAERDDGNIERVVLPGFGVNGMDAPRLIGLLQIAVQCELSDVMDTDDDDDDIVA